MNTSRRSLVNSHIIASDNNNLKSNSIEFIITKEEVKALEFIVTTQCCSNNCLKPLWKSSTDFEPALALLMRIRKQLFVKNVEEKKALLRNIINVANPIPFGSASVKLKNVTYTLGYGLPQFTPIPSCLSLFQAVYEISDRQIRNLRNDLRQGHAHSCLDTKGDPVLHDYNDTTIITHPEARRVVKSRAAFGEALLSEEIALLLTPNNLLAKLTINWMETFFKLVGDHMPNKVNEIHLEQIEIKEIWKEYVIDCANIYKIDSCLGYTHFTEFWRTFFPHVKIREYKAVSGKCYMCSVLSSLRKKFSENILRAEITELHALHRITYMSERRFYYARIKKACEDSANYLSAIGDGMAEAHCNLPWLGNLKEFSNPLVQHLQGLLVHGQIFRIFRSYPFTIHDSNLACYCFLATLEFHYIANGNKLPDTIFYQIDGGSENSNMFLIALCELVIIRRLTKRIYLTRLPVGHTHEDIDSKFGKIWKALRSTHQYTPQDYEAKLRSIFQTGKLPFEIHNIFVVPDFKRFFKPTSSSKFIDHKFSSYSKVENTQLGWKFCATERSKEYPLGCRTYNKTYFSDSIYEIIPDITGNSYTGYKAAKVLSKWMPQPSGHNPTGGMYLLKRLPNQPIYPAEFSDNGKELLDKTINEFDNTYGSLNSHQSYKEKWGTFVNEEAPQSNDVYEFIDSRQNGTYHVPFKNILFPRIDVITKKSTKDLNGYVDDSDDEVEVSKQLLALTVESSTAHMEFEAVEKAGDGDILNSRSVQNNIETIMTGEAVQWSNRGQPLPAGSHRITVDGTVVPTNISSEELEKIRKLSLLKPREDYTNFSNKSLKEMCVERKLKRTGNKSDLVERLVQYDLEHSPKLGDTTNTIIGTASDEELSGGEENDIKEIANSSSFNIGATFNEAVGDNNDTGSKLSDDESTEESDCDASLG